MTGRPSTAGARLAAVVVSALIGLAFGPAAGQTVTEAALKAAFLNKFARFTEWPEDALAANAPLTLCIANDRAVGESLRDIAAGHPVDGHELIVVSGKLDTLTPAVCRLLYVSGLDAKQSAALLDTLKGAPVLTVSDLTRFGESGGVVQLIVENAAVNFAVNREAAARARLRLSSQLLSFAKRVKDDPNAKRH